MPGRRSSFFLRAIEWLRVISDVTARSARPLNAWLEECAGDFHSMEPRSQGDLRAEIRAKLVTCELTFHASPDEADYELIRCLI